MSTALRVSEILLDALVVGSLTIERWRETNARMATIVAEGREPTAEEWQAEFARSAAADKAIDDAFAKLNPEE